MKKNLLTIIRNHFPDSNIDTNQWKYVLKNSTTVPSCFYLLNMVEYYVSYYKKNNSINLSLILYNNKEAVGIMPLIAHRNDKHEWILTSNGYEIMEPIFNKSLAPKVKKRLETELKNLIFDLVKKLNIRQLHFINMEFFYLSSWYLMWAKNAKEIFSTHHILVDLSLSLKDIRLKFRKSFKPFVNKGLREWKVEVYEKVTNDIFKKFRMLHKSVAGRSTRSIDSWDKQKKQIDLKESFIILVSDKSNVLVGGALFTYSRDNGFYSVGVYKRELSDKPIGHAVQMRAIETFKKME